MPRWWWTAAAVLLIAGVGLGQEPSSDQLRRMYDDALVKLKAAQDRKNELAAENENLNATVGELQKQLAEAQREAREAREKTFFLRAHYAVWEDFVEHYPAIASRWKVFNEYSFLHVLREPAGLAERDWPLPKSNDGR